MFNNFTNNAMGAMYAQQKPATPQNTQPLSLEEQKELKKKAPAFTTQLTREELLRSYCTHRTPDGSTLVPNPDGTATCAICGTTVAFPADGYAKEEVDEIVLKFINLLNVIKCQYLDIPPQIVKEFFQIMPYVEKVPALYDLAIRNFSSYSNKNIGGTNPVYGSEAYSFWNTFDMFHGAGAGNGAMMGGMGMAGYGTPQQNTGAGTTMMGAANNMGMVGGNPFFVNNIPPQAPVVDMNTINTGVVTNQQPPQDNNQQVPPQNINQGAMATSTTQVQL